MKLDQFSAAVEDHINTLDESGGGDDKGKDKPLPRPKEGDKKSIQEYRNQLHKKYGDDLKEREDLPEYLSLSYESEKTPVKDLISKSAKVSGLRPEVLYTSSMEEGMRGLFPDKEGNIDYTNDEKFPISGFQNFGLDRFSDAYSGLVKKGYLPKDFDKSFKKVAQTNEKNEKVNSAYFKDLDSAIQAKAAMVRLSQDEISDYAQSHKIPLSDKAKEFFTLVDYNAGYGNAQKMLSSYNQAGYLKDDSFLTKQPSESWSGPYQNVIKRVKAADALKSEGYF